jgi:C-terminal processing protease CtpA/Prc
LVTIYGQRPANGEQAYVSQAPGIGNPVFAEELGYGRMKNVDAGFRLLALFRLWNIVRYWSPYRDLVASDWDATLVEFIPRLAHAATFDAYQLEMLAFIARIRDTHANLWSSLQVQPPVGRAQLPVVVRFVADHAVVSAVLPVPGATPNPFQPGDIISVLDSQPVTALVDGWSAYYPASNSAARRRDLARNLTRGAPGKVTVGVERDGAQVELEADRLTLPSDRSPRRHDRAGPTFCRLSPEVAYLKLSSVKADDAASYVEQAAGTKGMIIDLRNYPSAFVVFALGSHLVEKKTDFASFTIGDLANPGAFEFGATVAVEPRPPYYSGRLVILIDEVTQSQAEYTTMAFRVARGAKVVGCTTAGADGNVSPIALPGGLSTMISGIGVYYPDRRPTQGVGIRPDIEVRPTVEGMRAGRDEILEAGLREILGSDYPEDKIRELAAPPAPAAGASGTVR